MASGSFGRRGAAAVAVRAPMVRTSVPIPAAPARPGFFHRLPWFTAALSLFLIYRFQAELRAATDFNGPNAPGHFSLLAMGASGRDQVIGHGEWWRLFTSSALHGSADHLIGNLVTFIVVGFLLEPMIGIGWFAAIYFTGGFAGALCSLMLNPANVLSVGASGAIMATLAALFTLSFHAGAPRPNLMRRLAGLSLFPALIPTMARGGTVTDINAHLGGCLAGAMLAFVMLILWREEEPVPPGRSFAALLAGMWLALTVWAFSASGNTYAQYARDGFDYIPPADMPRDSAAMQAGSYALVEKYPKDPRAHLFRGLYFLSRGNASNAEPHLRDAVRLGAGNPVMSPAFRDWTVALLALDVEVQGRAGEARILAAPLCARADLDARTRGALKLGRFCR